MTVHWGEGQGGKAGREWRADASGQREGILRKRKQRAQMWELGPKDEQGPWEPRQRPGQASWPHLPIRNPEGGGAHAKNADS